LLDTGYEVDVFCTRGAGEALVERGHGVRIYRIPLWHRRGGLIGYPVEHLLFMLFAAIAAATLHVRRRYRLVQVHTPPDVLVFAAAVPKLFGARVLLDLQECMPEFFATKLQTSPRHPLARVLAVLEQAAIRFADAALTRTDEMRDVFVARGADPAKITVTLNSADEEVFQPDRVVATPGEDGRFVLVSHGSVEPQYGLDTAVRAVALLSDELPDLHLDIYGDGTQRRSLHQLSEELGVTDRVHFSDGYVPIDELVGAIARADAGLVAVKRDPFRDVTQCFKMYEFVAMRRPVVASRTASAVASFDEDCFAWFESGDEKDLARAIRQVHDDPALRRRLVEKASARAEPYRWVHQRERYLSLVAELAGM
jgi:glycosyltransferase involved in cell wall biosynthesis